MELTKALNRAARGLLGWSLPVQAEKSGVALRKLRDLEQGRNNRLDLRAEEQALEAFRDAGVDFLAEENGSGAGVIFLERQGRESD